MSITRQQIKARTRYALGLWDNEGYRKLPEGLLNHLINEACKAVRIETLDKVENFYTTLTASQRVYTLPTDFLKDYEVYVERDTTTGFPGYKVAPRPYRDLLNEHTRFDQDDPLTGSPRRYAITSDNLIFLDPIPSSAVRMDIFYLAIPADLTIDSAVPDLNEIYHEMVLAKVKEMSAQEIGDSKKFAEFFQIYKTMLPTYKALANAKMSHSTQIGFSG